MSLTCLQQYVENYDEIKKTRIIKNMHKSKVGDIINHSDYYFDLNKHGLDVELKTIGEYIKIIEKKYKLFHIEVFNPYKSQSDEYVKEFDYFRAYFYYSDSCCLSVTGQLGSPVFDYDSTKAFEKMMEKDTFALKFNIDNFIDILNSELEEFTRFSNYPFYNNIQFDRKYYPDKTAQIEKEYYDKLGIRRDDNYELLKNNYSNLNDLISYLDSNKYIYELQQAYNKEPSFMRVVESAVFNIFIKESDSSLVNIRIKYPNIIVDTSLTKDAMLNNLKYEKDIQMSAYRIQVNDYVEYHKNKVKYFLEYMDEEYLKNSTLPYNRDYYILKRYYREILDSKLENKIMKNQKK